MLFDFLVSVCEKVQLNLQPRVLVLTRSRNYFPLKDTKESMLGKLFIVIKTHDD